MQGKFLILFLCTWNASRSIFAEYFMKEFGAAKFDAGIAASDNKCRSRYDMKIRHRIAVGAEKESSAKSKGLVLPVKGYHLKNRGLGLCNNSGNVSGWRWHLAQQQTGGGDDPLLSSHLGKPFLGLSAPFLGERECPLFHGR